MDFGVQPLTPEVGLKQNIIHQPKAVRHIGASFVQARQHQRFEVRAPEVGPFGCDDAARLQGKPHARPVFTARVTGFDDLFLEMAFCRLDDLFQNIRHGETEPCNLVYHNPGSSGQGCDATPRALSGAYKVLRRDRAMRAFVFPGQGAQTIGMGKALAEAYPAAQAVFDEVDEALGEKLSALIWEGEAETLTLTANAQPALMATSLATIRALEAEGVAMTDVSFVAGHSLGEYSALAAARSLSVGDAAKLLRVRGDAMQNAVPVGVGAMAALLGLDFETARAVAAEAAQGEVCQAANDNDPSQVVVSGHKAAVERACELAKEKGAKRALLLPVSAPFHCALMQPAADVMEEALGTVTLNAPSVPLVANVRAEAVRDADTIRSLLVEQVTGSVRWRESVAYMAAQGVTEIWEVGAGKALSGMIKRVDRSVATKAIGTPADVAAVTAN